MKTENRIECDELSYELNLDPDKISFLDFDNPVFEGMHVKYLGVDFIITTAEMLPGWGWRAWLRKESAIERQVRLATSNPV